MYALLLISVLSMLIAWQNAVFKPDTTASIQTVQADANAINFWSYQKAVSRYLQEHPETVGSIAHEQLSFSEGYIERGLWNHVIENNTLYVFSTQKTTKRAVKEIEMRGKGVIIGIAQADRSMLTLYGYAQTQSLPEQIPSGALVVVGK